jgi:hypothetical protein
MTILRWILKKQVWIYGFDSTGEGQVPVTSSRDKGNETSDSMKDRAFCD